MKTEATITSRAGRFIIGLLALVGLTWLAGCNNTPLEQATEVSQNAELVRLADSIATAYANESADTSSSEPQQILGLIEVVAGVAQGLVSATGGVLNLVVDGELVQFNVPSGAVTNSVNISIRGTKVTMPGGTVFIYECKPSGVRFNSPIWFDQPLDKPAGSEAVLYYNADYSYHWKVEAVSKVGEEGKARFYLHHFSKYGIS